MTMRFEATTTDEATILSFTGDGVHKSCSLKHSEARKLTVPEAIWFLFNQLSPVMFDTYDTADEAVELQTPREYLREKGAL
jgi:hypothetical protein